MSPDDLVVAGTVLRSHGLRGEVLARMVLTGPAVALPAGLPLAVGDRRLVLARCTVRDVRRVNLGFEGVATREDASGLAGLALGVERRAALSIEGFRPLELFAGMAVVSGRLEGVIERVLPDEANPLVEVRARDRLFPVPVSLLLASGAVDWTGGTVRVELPLGIEDLE